MHVDKPFVFNLRLSAFIGDRFGGVFQQRLKPVPPVRMSGAKKRCLKAAAARNAAPQIVAGSKNPQVK